MKILPTQTIYDSIYIEVGKSKSEILDILNDRMKYVARLTDDNTRIRMRRSQSYTLSTGLVGFSTKTLPSGNSSVNFDFYTRYPSTLKTAAFFITALFSVIFIPILFLVGFENFAEVLIFFLKFMLTLPVVMALILINEKVSRYTTEKFIHHIARDFIK